MDAREKVERIALAFRRLKDEIGQVIVGHEEIVEGVIICLLCGGHALLEGVPGLGKTMLVRTLGQVLNLKFSRIQFTPDLMPADIIGTNIVMQDDMNRKYFQFQQGPIFAQIILADEINRATPKTQSALLEAMQESSVTVGGVEYRLESPFIVLATQNPIEMEGTYPLPEAQLDRFFFKLNVRYPTQAQMSEIVDRTTQPKRFQLDFILNPDDLNEMKETVKEVPLASHVKDYAIRLVMATHPDLEIASPLARRYVRYGSSPRGVQSIVLAAKAKALLDGRFNVSFDDIRQATFPSLRHRLLLNFEGEAEGVEAERIIIDLLEHVSETPGE